MTMTVDHTYRSYAGRIGCQCGCQGTYSDKPRTRKMALNYMLKNKEYAVLSAWMNDEDGCLYIDTETRTRVVYLNPEGVKAARAAGFKEK